MSSELGPDDEDGILQEYVQEVEQLRMEVAELRAEQLRMEVAELRAAFTSPSG